MSFHPSSFLSPVSPCEPVIVVGRQVRRDSSSSDTDTDTDTDTDSDISTAADSASDTSSESDIDIDSDSDSDVGTASRVGGISQAKLPKPSLPPLDIRVETAETGVSTLFFAIGAQANGDPRNERPPSSSVVAKREGARDTHSAQLSRSEAVTHLSPDARRWLEILGRNTWCKPADTQILVSALLLHAELPPFTHVCLSIQPAEGHVDGQAEGHCAVKLLPVSAVKDERPDHGWVRSHDYINGFFNALAGALDHWTRGLSLSSGAHSYCEEGRQLRNALVERLYQHPETSNQLARQVPLKEFRFRSRAGAPVREAPPRHQPQPFFMPATGSHLPQVTETASRWLALFPNGQVWCHEPNERALMSAMATLTLRAMAVCNSPVQFHDARWPEGDQVHVPPGADRVLVVGLAPVGSETGVFAMARRKREESGMPPRLQPLLHPRTVQGFLTALAEALWHDDAPSSKQPRVSGLDRKVTRLHQQMARMLARTPAELERIAREAPLRLIPGAHGGGDGGPEVNTGKDVPVDPDSDSDSDSDWESELHRNRFDWQFD